MSIEEHKLFITDLISLCNTDDTKLMNFSCYKSITNFTPLRVSALRVLAACHYLESGVREQIFQVLYKTLEKPNAELQETAFECMKKFITNYPFEKEMVSVYGQVFSRRCFQDFVLFLHKTQNSKLDTFLKCFTLHDFKD